MFTLPDFIKRYVGEGSEKYFNAFPADPANDFNIQMAKLGNGLWSGKYSSISENSLDSESTGISPAMFKNVVGKNHPDFSTKQQQDAFDFYLHLINTIERNSRHETNPVEGFTISLEDRVECMSSKKVKYTQRDDYCLPLQIPLEKATNLDEVKEYLERKAADGANNSGDKNIVRHKVPLHACLERFFATEVLEQFHSTAANCITTAKRSTRLVNMPDFLLLHLRKFTLGSDWVPKKLDVSVDMPDELDLSSWRATGMQPNEQPLPETDDKPKFSFDENLMGELMQMGFPQEACKRAVFHTKNISLEAASNWLMEHIGDADISEPFVLPAGGMGDSKALNFIANPESVAMLMSMGFEERQATKALKATDGNIERATDWIFSHAEDMDTDEIQPEQTDNDAGNTRKKSYRDGVGKYKLAAFISHMGTSAQVGHYVCHILKNGRWVIYNDSKVALSQNPPKDLGYLYLYKRCE